MLGLLSLSPSVVAAVADGPQSGERMVTYTVAILLLLIHSILCPRFKDKTNLEFGNASDHDLIYDCFHLSNQLSFHGISCSKLFPETLQYNQDTQEMR